MYYFENVDRIYFNKTKEYFQEVISSYSVGNYRSATVMLYSVVICDMLFKLQELKDMYNDSIAAEILTEVEKSRNDKANKSKSRWEKEFVDHIYNRTELLDDEDYINISHLYDNRNLSAHPALNKDYELIAPSQETTAANIKNALKIFVKPPIFIKRVIDLLVEDLRKKKVLYEHEPNELGIYLNNRYYSRMSDSMKLSTIKALWKFCFNLPDDEDCIENQSINTQALHVLIESIPKEAREYIKNNNISFNIAQDDSCIKSAVILLSKHPELYDVLDNDPKMIIDSYIETASWNKLIYWFKYKTCSSHIEYLYNFPHIGIRQGYADYMMQHYSELGNQERVIDYFIYLYGNSTRFDTADNLFCILIEPYLVKMTEKQYIDLLQKTDCNDQIYGRRRAKYANTRIITAAKKKGIVIDLSIFEHVDYDREIYENDSDSNNMDLDGLEF